MSSVYLIVGSPKVQWNLGTDGHVEKTLLLKVPFVLYIGVRRVNVRLCQVWVYSFSSAKLPKI